MGKLLLLSGALVAVISVLIYVTISKITEDQEFTQTLPDFQWGKETVGAKEDQSIKPFRINVDQKVLDSLKKKLGEELNSGRFTPPLEGIGFHTNNSKYKKTRPLLLLHGWPGSFIEFQKIIPLLIDPKDSDINFELVIPSLPGYGYSEGAVRPGLGLVETSQIFVKLMKRLGHNKFYVQGGDWGSLIGEAMSKVYPQNLVAFHSNMCTSQHPRSHLKTLLGSFFPSYFNTPEETERFLPFSKYFTYILRETGYAHIQATKPDTLGVGLSQSPTGLAAYILEKFSGWTNPSFYEKEDGGLNAKFQLDDLLDNIMVYWVTNSITTSVRFYSENLSNRQRAYELDKVPSKVPTGCIVPRWEQFIAVPKSVVEDTYNNIISYTYAEDGGHFFALEHPDVLATDFVKFSKLAEGNGDLFSGK
ncbi:unnamed protein product [Allacma fusca]|uniref:Epoxide hydrolase n=1 Tax=Allacma fusca TaxID=39272 RepID=A0A8J2KZZ4_9HEXA|nr:unnamed protein product [Allacma fusca]